MRQGGGVKVGYIKDFIIFSLWEPIGGTCTPMEYTIWKMAPLVGNNNMQRHI